MKVCDAVARGRIGCCDVVWECGCDIAISVGIGLSHKCEIEDSDAFNNVTLMGGWEVFVDRQVRVDGLVCILLVK